MQRKLVLPATTGVMLTMRRLAFKLYAWCRLPYIAAMSTHSTPRMSPAQFQAAISSLGWKQSDFCRRVDLDKNTPSRWVAGKTPIPGWVPEYLGAMLAITRLHKEFVEAPRVHLAAAAETGPE